MPTYTAPGVYIEEIPKLPNSVVPVPTAIPAFIGYTPKAEHLGKSVYFKPQRINSLLEFEQIFLLPTPAQAVDSAKQYSPNYYVEPQSKKSTAPNCLDIAGTTYAILPDPSTIYYLYNSVRLFYQNGGGAAYILSVGKYGPAKKKSLAGPTKQIVNPNVKLTLRQGNPTQIATLVSSGEADLAIATEAIELFHDLIMLPCYQWNRCIVVPPNHPLLDNPILTLESIAQYPIVTYDFAFTGRSKINRAFEANGLNPNVVLTAIDSDVIKTYVELGLGIGILANMAFDPLRDQHLRSIDASHLFEPSTTRVGISRNSYIRGYSYDFIEMFAPHLTHDVVKSAMKGKPNKTEPFSF